MSTFIALYDRNSNGLWWSGEASSFSEAVRQLAADTGTGFDNEGDDKSLEDFAEGFWAVEITAEQNANLEEDPNALDWGTEDMIRDTSYVPGEEDEVEANLEAFGEWSDSAESALISAITVLRGKFNGGKFEDAGVAIEHDEADTNGQTHRAGLCIGYVDLDRFTRFDGECAQSLTDASQAPAIVANDILGWFDEDWIEALAA